MPREDINYRMRINREYPAMNPTERWLCDFIMQNSGRIAHMTITEAAECCEVSEASFVRLAQKLGYRGFQAMKLRIAQDVSDPSLQIHEVAQPGDSVEQIVDKVFRSSQIALRDTQKVLEQESVEQAIRAITNCDRLVFYGVGGSSAVALDAQPKFLKIGYLPLAFCDENIQAMSAVVLRQNDVAVGISHSGESRATLEAIRLAHRAGATVIAITNYSRSPILKYSDIVLYTSSPETAMKSDALASRIAQFAIIDALFVGVAFEKQDQSARNLQKTRCVHSAAPSGSWCGGQRQLSAANGSPV